MRHELARIVAALREATSASALSAASVRTRVVDEAGALLRRTLHALRRISDRAAASAPCSSPVVPPVKRAIQPCACERPVIVHRAQRRCRARGRSPPWSGRRRSGSSTTRALRGSSRRRAARAPHRVRRGRASAIVSRDLDILERNAHSARRRHAARPDAYARCPRGRAASSAQTRRRSARGSASAPGSQPSSRRHTSLTSAVGLQRHCRPLAAPGSGAPSGGVRRRRGEINRSNAS